MRLWWVVMVDIYCADSIHFIFYYIICHMQCLLLNILFQYHIIIIIIIIVKNLYCVVLYVLKITHFDS